MAIIKRQRENEETDQTIDLANSLMLLSSAIQSSTKPPHKTYPPPAQFECKTCNRKFSSFQALGGHRASHKRPKHDEREEHIKSEANKWTKPKMHECSICGIEFSLGQALGGHMRKHRVAAITNIDGEGFSSSICQDIIIKAAPVLKRSNSSKRVIMGMDLNLTPLENDLKLLFGNRAPQVDLSLF